MAATAAGKSLVQFKQLFFDRGAVEKAAGKAKVRALSKFGAWVRRAAQTSMRYRKKASAPGSPPSAHRSKQLQGLKKIGRTKFTGALLREMLYFAYDPASGSVVVGPVGFKGKGTPVPSLHEHGGSVPAGRRVMSVGTGKGLKLVRLTGTLRYPPRPFMKPALDKVLPKFAACFAGTVTR